MVNKKVITNSIDDKAPSLSVIFNLGATVADWHARGLIAREKRLFEELISKGHVKEVFLHSYGADDRQFERYIGSRKIRIASRPKSCHPLLYSLTMPIQQREIFRQASFIRTIQTAGAWTPLLTAKLYNKPLIVRSGYTWSLFARRRGHVEALDRLSWLIEFLLYRTCDAALVSTQSQKIYICKRYGIALEKVFVVPNYVDTQVFRPISTKKSSDRMVFVGRLEPQKNLDGMIRALNGTKWGLDIYGSGSQQRSLSRLAKELKVSVTFNGPIENNELPRLLNLHRIFVMPSFYEGMPKAVLEAMACGLAVLGADVVGINEVVNHNETGWLVSPDVTGLRSGVERLLSDDGLVKRLGNSAAEAVRDQYSLSNVVNLEGQVLRTLLGRKR